MQTLELDAAMSRKRIKDELVNCYFAYLTSLLFGSTIGILLTLPYTFRSVSLKRDVVHPI